MIRRPPRSTRTDTLFPYTTLFRSDHRHMADRLVMLGLVAQGREHVAEAGDGTDRHAVRLAGQRRQRVIGAEDIARAVDEVEAVFAGHYKGKPGLDRKSVV